MIIVATAAIVLGTTWGIAKVSGALDSTQVFSERGDFGSEGINEGIRPVPPEGFDREFDRNQTGFSPFSVIGIFSNAIVIAVIMAAILIPRKLIAKFKTQST